MTMDNRCVQTLKCRFPGQRDRDTAPSRSAPSPIDADNRHASPTSPCPGYPYSPKCGPVRPQLRTIVLPIDRPPLNNRCIEQIIQNRNTFYLSPHIKRAHHLVLNLFFVWKSPNQMTGVHYTQNDASYPESVKGSSTKRCRMILFSWLGCAYVRLET